MKKVLFFFFLFCLSCFSFAQEKIGFPGNIKYNPFYAMTIYDSDGTSYRILDARYCNPEGEDKFFVWFRRGTDRGIAEYPLDFKKIKSLRLTGNYEIFPDGYTPCQITLSSGITYEGFLDTSGYIAGMDEEFGTFVRIYLQYNGVASLEFIHDGRYKRCPFCNALYYNSEMELCPFDKTPLIQQNP